MGGARSGVSPKIAQTHSLRAKVRRSRELWKLLCLAIGESLVSIHRQEMVKRNVCQRFACRTRRGARPYERWYSRLAALRAAVAAGLTQQHTAALQRGRAALAHFACSSRRLICATCYVGSGR